jgi:hypothetical protein
MSLKIFLPMGEKPPDTFCPGSPTAQIKHSTALPFHLLQQSLEEIFAVQFLTSSSNLYWFIVNSFGNAIILWQEPTISLCPAAIPGHVTSINTSCSNTAQGKSCLPPGLLATYPQAWDSLSSSALGPSVSVDPAICHGLAASAAMEAILRFPPIVGTDVNWSNIHGTVHIFVDYMNFYRSSSFSSSGTSVLRYLSTNSKLLVTEAFTTTALTQYMRCCDIKAYSRTYIPAHDDPLVINSYYFCADRKSVILLDQLTTATTELQQQLTVPANYSFGAFLQVMPPNNRIWSNIGIGHRSSLLQQQNIMFIYYHLRLQALFITVTSSNDHALHYCLALLLEVTPPVTQQNGLLVSCELQLPPTENSTTSTATSSPLQNMQLLSTHYIAPKHNHHIHASNNISHLHQVYHPVSLPPHATVCTANFSVPSSIPDGALAKLGQPSCNRWRISDPFPRYNLKLPFSGILP